AELIAHESGGNPFFINELVRFSHAQSATQKQGAAAHFAREIGLRDNTLERVILTRINRLAAPVRRLLEIVSIAGYPLELTVAAQAADVDMEVNSALAVLRADHLIRTRSIGTRNEIVIYHDRIRETIVANLSEETRKMHHYRLALALESSGQADPEMLT